MIEYKNFQVTASDGYAVLNKYSLVEKAAILPDNVDGLPLRKIASGAFAGEASTEHMVKREHIWEEIGEGAKVEEIVLPDTVEEIGEGAFARCQELLGVRFPKAIQKLPDYLFSDCRKLLPFSIPASVKEIGDYAFQNCRSLTKIVLPQGLERIGNYAFYNCRGLKELKLPGNVKSLGTGALKNCESLSFIALAGHKNIQNVVADMHHPFTLSIQYPSDNGSTVSAYLYFPEEACEYYENYPARQFRQVNYGTGHLYRQCISNRDIDYQRYDQIFHVARREEPFERQVKIAVFRLCYPYSLPNERREEYKGFFQDNLLQAMSLLFEKNDMAAVEALAMEGIFTTKNIDALIQLAVSKRKTAFSSFLMNYQHKNIKQAERNFEL